MKKMNRAMLTAAAVLSAGALALSGVVEIEAVDLIGRVIMEWAEIA